jgi:hypothetical protein
MANLADEGGRFPREQTEAPALGATHMATHHDSAGYYRRRAAEQRARAKRAPYGTRRLIFELADLFVERARLADEAKVGVIECDDVEPLPGAISGGSTKPFKGS